MCIDNLESLDQQVINVGTAGGSGAAATATLDAEEIPLNAGVGCRFIVTGLWCNYDLPTAMGTISIAGIKAADPTVLGVIGVDTVNILIGCPLVGKTNTDIVATLLGLNGRIGQVTIAGYWKIGQD